MRPEISIFIYQLHIPFPRRNQERQDGREEYKEEKRHEVREKQGKDHVRKKG
jgi:hypothetical protein